MPNLNRRPAWLTLQKTTLVLSVCIATAACWALSSSIFNPLSASVANADDEKPRQEKTRQRDGDRTVFADEQADNAARQRDQERGIQQDDFGIVDQVDRFAFTIRCRGFSH